MNNKIEKKKTLFIIGLPGCGKTTLSKILAKYLNYNFYDMDLIIEEKEKMKISQIFEIRGEKYFREKESEILEELSELKNAVISTGGGIILSQKNREIMKKKGITIFINRNLETLLNNIDASERPLLTKDKNKLIELSKEREPLYKESADIIFTHNTWEENIEETFNIFYDYIKNEISLSVSPSDKRQYVPFSKIL